MPKMSHTDPAWWRMGRLDAEVGSPQDSKGVWLHGIYDGAPGGGSYGLNVVSLVK